MSGFGLWFDSLGVDLWGFKGFRWFREILFLCCLEVGCLFYMFFVKEFMGKVLVIVLVGRILVGVVDSFLILFLFFFG